MITKLVRQLKNNDQDFELYPTTQEIIDALLRDLGKSVHHDSFETYKRRRDTLTFLDIGAGTGKVLKAVNKWSEAKNEQHSKDYNRGHSKSFDFWAIEKSQILTRELVKHCLVVGADFHRQSLINLESDITFCNPPPYSEFVEWTQKIIRECNTKIAYLVLPVRWKNSEAITRALRSRDSKVKVIDTFTFINSEDRAARGEVDLIRITHEVMGDDLFDTFFYEEFGHLVDKHNEIKEEENKKEAEFKERTNEMVKHKGLVLALTDAYDEEIEKIDADFAAAISITPSIMAALGVEPMSILTVLKAKKSGLRVEYWEKLINEMKEIRQRLTSGNRDSILNRIKETAKMDFNTGNIYAILMWVLEKANSYIDTQIVDVFDSMINEASVRNYKSNQRVFEKGEWQYHRSKPDNLSHVKLDYRIVLYWGGLHTESYSSDVRLSECGQKRIGDLLTVANSLGYVCNTGDPRIMERYGQSGFWSSGKNQVFEDSEGRVIAEIKAFKNQNMHIRMGQEFAVKLNATVGRLRGWIKSPKDAEEEIGKGAGEAFNINTHMGSVGLLLTCNKAPALTSHTVDEAIRA